MMPFKKQNNYNEHMKRHELMSHDCGCNNIVFTNFNQKHRHMRVKHQGYLNCDLCPKSFATEQFLNEHKAGKHPEKIENTEKSSCATSARDLLKRRRA